MGAAPNGPFARKFPEREAGKNQLIEKQAKVEREEEDGTDSAGQRRPLEGKRDYRKSRLLAPTHATGQGERCWLCFCAFINVFK